MLDYKKEMLAGSADIFNEGEEECGDDILFHINQIDVYGVGDFHKDIFLKVYVGGGEG